MREFLVIKCNYEGISSYQMGIYLKDNLFYEDTMSVIEYISKTPGSITRHNPLDKKCFPVDCLIGLKRCDWNIFS